MGAAQGPGVSPRVAGGISGRGKASLGWRVGLSVGRIQAGAGAGVGDSWARAGLLRRKEAGLRRGPERDRSRWGLEWSMDGPGKGTGWPWVGAGAGRGRPGPRARVRLRAVASMGHGGAGAGQGALEAAQRVRPGGE